MSTSAFEQGAELQIEGRCCTLLRLVEADLWQVEDRRTKRIEEISSSRLHSLYVEGKLKFNSTPVPSGISGDRAPLVTYSPEQWEAAKVRRAYVMATLDVPNTAARIVPVIEALWRSLKTPPHPPNRVTVFRWRRRFLNAGKDITTLMDRNDLKGNTAPRYPHEVMELLQQSIEKKYLALERGTIQDVLDYASNLIRVENQLRPEALRLPRPTRRLLRRMISDIPAFDRDVARHGRTAAVKKYRACLQHRTTAAPLERAEIDHTLLDLMVVDDSSGLPLGRPWITVCIDDYSRCILGAYVEFEPPSYLSVARCLKRALLPKVGLREQFPAVMNEWKSHGVMRELVVDNGLEFHSSGLENACYSLGIELHYSARKTPWFKGKIERFLGTLNRAVAHGSPGTTFSNIFEKDEYDSSKHAVIRYPVLKEVVHIWIADVYHQKIHRTLGVAPASMWASAIKPEEILVPDDPARLDAILGRSEQRRLTHKGIELGGLFYNSPDLTHLRRAHGENLKVEVRVDAENLGEVIVISPDNRQMFTVPALRTDYASGLSEYQHRICRRFAARELNASSEDAWLEARARISDLIESEFKKRHQRTRKQIARYKGESVLDSRRSLGDAIGKSQSDASSVSAPAPVAAMVAVGAPPEDVGCVTPRKKFAPVYRPRNQERDDIEDESNAG